MASHLPLCSVNHISRVVADVEESKAFYRDILGFTEVKRPASFDFGGSW
jgi:catechol 2,3-dioxygenase-like lactoylglutathione lyase family enzyme